MMLLERDSDFSQAVFALHAPRRFAGCHQRGKEHAHKCTDDRDHDQEFKDGERSLLAGMKTSIAHSVDP
jgi:hypothetical protein